MKTINSIRAFTLTEVLVATTVIALLAVSLFQFVSYAGDAWQRTHMTITLASEGNALLDTVERELSDSIEITSPLPGPATSNVIRYKRWVPDYTTTSGTAALQILFQAPSTVKKAIVAPPTGWTSVSGNSANNMNPDLYNFDLARHVTLFEITRISLNMLSFRVILKAVRANDGFDKTIEAKRTILLPFF